MEFKLLSDLHIEFGEFRYEAQPGDEELNLILAGDIGVGTRHRELVEYLCSIFKNVFYLHGNHEFYHQEVYDLKHRWWQIENTLDNFYLMDDDTYIVDGIRYVGGTLWTSMDNDNWFAKHTAENGINDYRTISIKIGDVVSELRASDTVAFHNKTVEAIKKTLEEPFYGPTIVLSHHLPLLECVEPRFKTDKLTPAFASDLSNIFRDYDFDVWVHGHGHRSVELNDVYGKRVYANPRGYVNLDPNPEFDKYRIYKV